MHQKVRMFLLERDRAYARNDVGIIHSMNAELRRLGVADTATLANPTGKRHRNGRVAAEPKPAGRPKLPRCEHENIAERCPICNEEIPDVPLEASNSKGGWSKSAD